MELYLNVGAPVYFVLEGKFAYETNTTRDLVCGSAGCDLYSLVEQVSRASKQPEFTTIETPPSSWVDDYVDWLLPRSQCCRNFAKNSTDQSAEHRHRFLSCQNFCKASNFGRFVI